MKMLNQQICTNQLRALTIKKILEYVKLFNKTQIIDYHKTVVSQVSMIQEICYFLRNLQNNKKIRVIYAPEQIIHQQ
jgi:hypothetical protein